MFSLLLSKTWGYIAGAGALIITVLAALGMAKRSGKKEEQADETAQSLQQAKDASTIDANVHALSDADLAAKLRSVQREK